MILILNDSYLLLCPSPLLYPLLLPNTNLDCLKAHGCYIFRKNGVTGSLHGTGQNVMLVAQHATLIDTLTAKETLQFAASLKLPSASLNERHHAVSFQKKKVYKISICS